MLRNILSQGIVDLISQIFTVVTALIMMVSIDPFLFIVCVVLVLALLIVGICLGAKTRPAAEQLQHDVAKMSNAFDCSLRAIHTIRAYCVTNIFTQKIAAKAQQAQLAGYKVATLRSLVGGFISAATSLILIGVIGIGAVQVSTKALSIGQLSAFIMYVMMVIMPAAQIGGISASMNEALGAYARIRDYLSMPTEDNGTASESEIKDYKPNDRKNLVSFENVGFSYQGKDEKQVLDNITFSIPQSGFTAIVGPSGAGKSTLFSLMERLYDPTYGHIKLSGVDISSIPLKKYRSKLAYT